MSFRPPLGSYVRNWTRTLACQLVRVFRIVRVMLNGIHHIGHLQFDDEAFAWPGWPILPGAAGSLHLLPSPNSVEHSIC